MLKRKHMPLTEQLRQAIDQSGYTRYRIAQETGVSESTLSLFANGNRGLSMEAMDAVGQFLELEIVSRRKPTKKGK